MTDPFWDAAAHLDAVSAAAQAAVSELEPARGHLSAEERGRLRILRAELKRADELLELEIAWCEQGDEQ